MKLKIYDVGFWEYVYEAERKKYNDFLMNKARFLLSLESKDLNKMPDAESLKTIKQIEFLSKELNVMYGFLLFSDKMKECYESSLENIYDNYHQKQLKLELMNSMLIEESKILNECYDILTQKVIYLMPFKTIKTTNNG